MGIDYFCGTNAFLLNPLKVVITGGPSTGKTSVIDLLEKKGYFCVHELIRSMTSAEKKEGNEDEFITNPIVSVKDPEKFNKALLDGRVGQYQNALKKNTNVVFFDRGIPDVHAYMHCFDQSYDQDFAQPNYDYRYDHILIMPPWEEIYAVDNERFETYEESLRIFESLQSTYIKFGYDVTLIPKDSVEKRTDFILDHLNLI